MVINYKYQIFGIFVENESNIVYKVFNKNNSLFYAMNLIPSRYNSLDLLLDQNKLKNEITNLNQDKYIYSVYESFIINYKNLDYIAIVINLKQLGYTYQLNNIQNKKYNIGEIQKYAYYIFKGLSFAEKNIALDIDRDIENIMFNTYTVKPN